LNELRVARVVRRLHEGIAPISQRFYHLEQFDLIAEVQTICRLVHKDRFRALNQRARDIRQLPPLEISPFKILSLYGLRLEFYILTSLKFASLQIKFY